MKRLILKVADVTIAHHDFVSSTARKSWLMIHGFDEIYKDVWENRFTLETAELKTINEEEEDDEH